MWTGDMSLSLLACVLLPGCLPFVLASCLSHLPLVNIPGVDSSSLGRALPSRSNVHTLYTLIHTHAHKYTTLRRNENTERI